MKITCVGSATKDIFFPTSEGLIMDTLDDVTAQKKVAFEMGAKYHISQRHETLGGCSVNVAVGLSRLGIDASCYVPVGDDMVGDWIIKSIADENIDTEGIEKIKNSASDLSAIIVDEASGERIIFSNHDASQKMKINDEKIDFADWIFVGDLSGNWKRNMEIIFKKAKAKNIKIAFNPRQQMLHENISGVVEIVKLCDVLFVNKDEAIEMVQGMVGSVENINDEEYLARSLQELGCGIVLVTDGTRGAWCFDGNTIVHADALLQKAVDTTGSGDAFASGFLGAFLAEKTMEESLKWGIANSSNSVKEYGGQKGLLHKSEIEKIAAKVNIC